MLILDTIEQHQPKQRQAQARTLVSQMRRPQPIEQTLVVLKTQYAIVYLKHIVIG
jgi:hypothetical protein